MQLIEENKQLQDFLNNKEKEVYGQFHNNSGSSGEEVQYLISLLEHWKHKADQVNKVIISIYSK